MPLGTRTSRVWGACIGGALVVAAVASVLLIEWGGGRSPDEVVIRPVKTLEIGAGDLTSGRHYPGRVRAGDEVALAFEVAGQLIELPVRKGEAVKAGQLVARLDERDYENALDAKRAVLAKAESDLAKVRRLVEAGAAAQRELTEAEASYNVATAEARIAQKALDDTRLLAPFDGMIANTFADNFQTIQAKQQVVSLQSVTQLLIEVSVPEARVMEATPGQPRFRFAASFDYLPGREFEVTLAEFTTEADPITQTYTATFLMPRPEDVTILPGMTATIREYLLEGETASGEGVAVPLSAVPVDGAGRYFVWRVEPLRDDLFTVTRTDVSVGPMAGDRILVREGLSIGDRIAAAGVHVLQDGQTVRLFTPKAEARLP
jgi:multidrug efflux system membrane fusion protein